MAFQKANKLSSDGVAGSKTMSRLSSGSAVNADGKATATATAAPQKVAYASTATPLAGRVRYANWYTNVKDVCRKYPYATVYDFATGISWQVHIFSLGAHADYEPLTAADTSRMLKVFGGNTWNPRAVWVTFADGSVYIASTHSMPHGVIHITDNNFEGHSCLHFPRTQTQVEAIGTYANERGYGVVEDLVGHGIGTSLHEDPQVPNFRQKGRGMLLVPGMTIAIEPMITAGGKEVQWGDDDWTVTTIDGSLAAHYENTVLITDGEPELFTLTHKM